MTQKFTMGRPVKETLKEYARGIVGGLIFNFPMLYTMETWWHGFIADPASFIVLVCATYLLLLAYNRYAGMRKEVSFRSVMVDSVEEMCIGLVISFGVLLMLGRIHLSHMGMDEVMGKVVVVGMAVSIGTAQLLGAGSSGAVTLGGNIAPTQEIPMIAFEVSSLHILGVVLVSLLISAVVVFFSDFRGASKVEKEHLVYNITFDTCISYLTALGLQPSSSGFSAGSRTTALKSASRRS